MYRKPIGADKPAGKAHPAAMIIPVEYSRRFSLPCPGIAELVRFGIAYAAGEVSDGFAAPFVYLVAYGAVVLHGFTPKGEDISPAQFLMISV